MKSMATRVAPSCHRSIGQLLIDGGFIDHTQLGEALTAKSGSSKRLGEILEDRRADQRHRHPGRATSAEAIGRARCCLE